MYYTITQGLLFPSPRVERQPSPMVHHIRHMHHWSTIGPNFPTEALPGYRSSQARPRPANRLPANGVLAPRPWWQTSAACSRRNRAWPLFTKTLFPPFHAFILKTGLMASSSLCLEASSHLDHPHSRQLSHSRPHPRDWSDGFLQPLSRSLQPSRPTTLPTTLPEMTSHRASRPRI